MFAQLSQHRNLLLLALLLLLCIFTALASFIPLSSAQGEYHNINLTKAHYAGFAAVVFCLLSYFIAPRYFRRAIGFTLILAVVGLANFLPMSISMGINLGESQIGLNPLFLVLLVIFYFLNRTSASTFIRQYILPAPSPKQAADRKRESINQFKETFARKTDDSLRQIVQERKVIADAITAAHELLTERHKPPPSGTSSHSVNSDLP